MQIALKRRLRQPLPLHSSSCRPPHGCGGTVDCFGDHALACPRTGPPGGPSSSSQPGCLGAGCPQQWLAHTTAPNVGAQDRRRLDLIVYGALSIGGAQCCDATLVSPVSRSGHRSCVLRLSTEPHCECGPQTLVVLSSEVVERPGSSLRAGSCAPEGLPRPAGHPRGSHRGMGAALVEYAFGRSAAGSHWHGFGPRLATAAATGGRSRPAARRHPPPRCPRGTELLAFAALERGQRPCRDPTRRRLAGAKRSGKKKDVTPK